MARRSRMSMLKRQREVQKSEKAARKRARRQGKPLEVPSEPIPASVLAEPAEDETQPAEEAEATETDPE